MTTDAPIDAIKIEHNTISKELSRFRACDAETRCYFCREWAQFVYKKHFAYNTKQQPEGNAAKSLNILQAGRYRLKLPVAEKSPAIEQRSGDLFEPFKKMLEDPAAALCHDNNNNSNTLIDGIVNRCQRWIEQPSRVVTLPVVLRPVHFDPYDPVLFDEDGPKDPARLLEPLVSERQHIVLPAKNFHLLKNLTGDILLSYKEATCDHIRPEWKSPNDLEVDRDIFNEKMEKIRKGLMAQVEVAITKAWQHLTEFLKSLQVLDKERATLMGSGCQKTIDDFVERQKIQSFDDYWAVLGEQYKKNKAAVDIETVDKAFETYFDQLAVHTQQFLKEFALPRLKAIHELVKKLWVLVISTIEKMADRMLASGEKNEMHLEQCRMLSTSLKDLHPTSDVLVNVETVQRDIEGKINEYLEDIAKLKKAYKDENQKNVRSRLEKISGSKTVKKQIKRVANGYAGLRQHFGAQVTQKIFPETLFAKFGLIVAEALMQEGENAETVAIDTVIQQFLEEHEELVEERQYLIDDFEEGVVTGRTELAGVLGRLFMTEIKRIQGEIQARQRQRDLLKSFGVDVDEKDEEGSGKKKKSKKKKKASGSETTSASPTPSTSTVSDAAASAAKPAASTKASEAAKPVESKSTVTPKAPPTLVIKNMSSPAKEKETVAAAKASTPTPTNTKSVPAPKTTAKTAVSPKPAVTKKAEPPKAKAVEPVKQPSLASKIAATLPPKEPVELPKPKQTAKQASSDGWQTIPSKNGNAASAPAPAVKEAASVVKKEEQPKKDGWNTVAVSKKEETTNGSDSWNTVAATAAAKKEETKAPSDGWTTVASGKKEEPKADGWNTVAAASNKKGEEAKAGDGWEAPKKEEKVKTAAADGWNTVAANKKQETKSDADGWGAPAAAPTVDGWGATPVKTTSSSAGWDTPNNISSWDSSQKTTVDGWNTAATESAPAESWDSAPSNQDKATGWGSELGAKKDEAAVSDGWAQKKQAVDGWGSSPSKQEFTTSDSWTNDEGRGWNTKPAQNDDLGGWGAEPAANAGVDGWGAAPSSNNASGWVESNLKNKASNDWNAQPAASAVASDGWGETKDNYRAQKTPEVDNWNSQSSKSVDRWENVGKEARARSNNAMGNSSWGSTTPTSDRGWGSPIKTTSSVPMDGHNWTANTEKDWNSSTVGGWNAKEKQTEESTEVVNFSLKDLLQQQQQQLQPQTPPPNLQQPSLLQQQQQLPLMPQSASPSMPPGLNKSETTPSAASLVQIAQDQALSPQKILEMDRESIVKVIEELQRENIKLLQTLVTTQQEMAMQSTRYTELLQLSRERESQMLQLFEARKQTELEEARRYILSLEARINTLENQLKSTSHKGGVTAGFGNQDLFAGYREEMHQQQRKPYFSRRATLKCANCGKSGHASADCRLACRYCGSNDHLSDACLTNN